ncbi:M16 family metallopeptidase [Candidatus Magnetaquicoccus inordinatus]|uniref:M16 family metallopeptidase n=1 Tax=Candidatus Magnetaquicoccus inordinatus TaxID=2496818 RepID=UPI00102C7068|nr:pitrilysin family protein [Candidatus Magnetaquicoccus inordinatus]
MNYLPGKTMFSTDQSFMDPPIPDPAYQLTTLANGLLVATFPMPWLHEVGVTLVVRAGSRYEAEDQTGIAHFLEHMLFKGTHSIPDPTALHARLESMAADMNAATGQESNAYWITLPPRYLSNGFTLFCEMFTQPLLAGIETERQVILEEMREDENEKGENINPVTLAGCYLWPDHPLARSVLGTRESIKEIDNAALRAYLQRHYCGANMAVAFCGPVEHAQAVQLTERCLGALPVGSRQNQLPPSPMRPGPHWIAADDQISQFTLNLFFRCGGYQDAFFYHVAALRRLLDDGFSSRLHASLREQRGLVYDVWSSLTGHSDTGVLEVGATVSLENLPIVYAALLEQLQRLIDSPPDAEEWQRLMTRWHANLMTTLDRPSELLERYVSDRLFDTMESLPEAWQRIEQVTPEQLPQVAKTLLHPSNRVLVLVGPHARKKMALLQAIK